MFKLIFQSVMVLFLVSCASQPESDLNNLKQRVSSLESKLSSWEKVKPSIDRVVALESDLNAVVKELDALAQAPVEAANSATIEQHLANEKAEQEKPFYTLHLGSFSNDDNVKKAWKILSYRLASFDKNTPTFTTVINLNHQRYIRLFVGKFKNLAQAEQECQKIIRQYSYCKPYKKAKEVFFAAVKIPARIQ